MSSSMTKLLLCKKPEEKQQTNKRHQAQTRDLQLTISKERRLKSHKHSAPGIYYQLNPNEHDLFSTTLVKWYRCCFSSLLDLSEIIYLVVHFLNWKWKFTMNNQKMQSTDLLNHRLCKPKCSPGARKVIKSSLRFSWFAHMVWLMKYSNIIQSVRTLTKHYTQLLICVF